MASLHSAIPLAGVGGMPVGDHQMSQYPQAAPLFQHANVPPPMIDATMTDVSGPLLPALLPSLRFPVTGEPGTGPWPMDQDTDYLPIITTLLNILRISTEQTVLDGNGTMSSPSSLAAAAADVAANAMHTSYHRGFSEGQRLANVDRESAELFIHNSAYAMGVTESVQQAEARFSAVRNQIAWGGYQQGWTEGSEATSATIARAFTQAVTGVAEQAYAFGRSQAIAEAQREILEIQRNAFAQGQQSAQRDAEGRQKQETETSDGKSRALNKTIGDLQRRLDETEEEAAKTQKGLSTSAATAAAKVEEERLQLSIQADKHREAAETAQRDLAQEKQESREHRRETRQVANQQRRTIAGLRYEAVIAERAARTQTAQFQGTIQRLNAERDAKIRKRRGETAQLHRHRTELRIQLMQRFQQAKGDNEALARRLRHTARAQTDQLRSTIQQLITERAENRERASEIAQLHRQGTQLMVQRRTLVRRMQQVNRHNAALVEFIRNHRNENLDMQTAHMEAVTLRDLRILRLIAERDAAIQRANVAQRGHNAPLDPYGEDVDGEATDIPGAAPLEYEDAGADDAMTSDEGEGEGNHDYETGLEIEPDEGQSTPVSYHSDTQSDMDTESEGTDTAEEVDNGYTAGFDARQSIGSTAPINATLVNHGPTAGTFQMEAVAGQDGDEVNRDLASRLGTVAVSAQGSATDHIMDPLSASLNSASLNDDPSALPGRLGAVPVREAPGVQDQNTAALPFDLPGLREQLNALAPFLRGPSRGQPQIARAVRLGATAPYSRTRGSAP